ncbi:DUF4238 domain-containing protein [Verrucomicrobia bacterium S94]|nr:DUF4238 domain-containing protein [Verrucomicrobia bacterium S94]
MASNKNQHYVPQCYLRQFADADCSATINLFNLDRKTFIQKAPIKGQCSKSYFYGEDLELEKALQPFESQYSLVVSEIVKNGYRLTNEHRFFLKRFWLLQYMRTEAASRRAIELNEKMGETVGETAREFKLGLKEAVQQSMLMFIREMKVIDDLSICLIKNESDTSFITSDDPAVLTNRWHLQNRKTRGRSFGLGTGGNLCLLPLSPKIICLLYDEHVYTVAHKNGWVKIKDNRDADAINQHQVLNCRANIFTHDNQSATALSSLYTAIESSRPPTRVKINYAVLDQEVDGYKKYRVVDREDAPEHTNALMHFQSINPTPTAWPKQIRLRQDGYVYTNGSGAGYVRKEHVPQMSDRGYWKEKIVK